MARRYQSTLDLSNSSKEPFRKVVEARPHTPAYLMHKYWARRPWNVFRELVSHYTSPGAIVLDPFCGGGVTIVESLILKRKAIGVDINPLATYITEMETRQLDTKEFWERYRTLEKEIKPYIRDSYQTSCPSCGKAATLEWMEWDENARTQLRAKGTCSVCGTFEKKPDTLDMEIAERYERGFEKIRVDSNLWYPEVEVPFGDKTSDLLRKGIEKFHDLFTKRNLFVLSLLHNRIRSLPEDHITDFMLFTFSSMLKWASRMSHLRGDIVEGWAMHAYWIYPRSLELNVWNAFTRRCKAVARGKNYTNKLIGAFSRPAECYDDLKNGKGTCLILTQSSEELPIPDAGVDAVITDPPYGGNVNYGELSDYFLAWLRSESMNKDNEIIMNKTQEKTLREYEKGLERVFEECFRVLKEEGVMVMTFNSKDSRVLSSCILAASRAGFTLDADGVLYQPPIRAYQTAFHGFLVDSFTGDFLLTFHKRDTGESRSSLGLEELKLEVDLSMEESYQERATERMTRERIYDILLSFLGTHANDSEVCDSATEYVEKRFREFDKYFSDVRKKIEKERRLGYLEKKQGDGKHGKEKHQ